MQPDLFTCAELMRCGYDPDQLLDAYVDAEMDVVANKADRVSGKILQKEIELDLFLTDVSKARNLEGVKRRLESSKKAVVALKQGVDDKRAELKQRKENVQALRIELQRAQLDAQRPSAWDREFPKIATILVRGVRNGHT